MAAKKKQSKVVLAAARVRKAVRYEQIAWRRTASIVAGQVLYESFSGNGMLDNPEAIFAALLAAEDLQHLRHVWVLRDLGAYRSTVARFAGDRRVRFVLWGSDGYYEALARSQYLVNNATFPPEFGKRQGQVYVNTWHGTPLKMMGYDIPGGGPATRNIVRNFVSADYLLAGNAATTTMYETAYKLGGIFRGKIVQEGTARIDRQVTTGPERAAIRTDLATRGISVAPGQKLLLYAPTWRGSFYAPTNDVMQLLARVRKLQHLLTPTPSTSPGASAGASAAGAGAGAGGAGGYRVVLKVHQRVYDFAAAQPELRELLIPNDIPTNTVLGATDVLVTDYSSIFFDFLATGRPILFYLPDEATYTDTRGLYLPPADLPGPSATSIESLAATVNHLGDTSTADPLISHADAYQAAAARYCPREDGHAAERLIDIIFRNHTHDQDGRPYQIRQGLPDTRTSILIHLGGMRSNGITRSALSLLDNIDHDRFDVSVFYAHSTARDQRRNEDAINPNVRLFPRIGGINGSKLLRPGRQAMTTRGINAVPRWHQRTQNRALHDEWHRCFGDATFDHIVDFSGYNPLWSMILLQGPTRTRSIFLHNDLLADSEREISGKRPHQANLRAVFSTYHQFDHLISVSPALADLNRTKLATHADTHKFVSAANTTNYHDILRMAYGPTNPNPNHPNPDPNPTQPSRPTLIDVDNLPAAIETLMHHNTLDAVIAEVTRRDTIQRLVPPTPATTTFVTAGRLSPEKNHTRLIRAFDLVHREHPHTRLIIMGRGPLREHLENLVIELGLVTAVTLAGQQDNPYAVMAHSDCFVLSSDYEGQPMVLLEAMILALPIITTNFASVTGALPPGTGHIVPLTTQGLADGMRAHLNNHIPTPTFDYTTYNHNAVHQFYTAIGATPEPPTQALSRYPTARTV